MGAEINAADINNQGEVTVSVGQETKNLITSQTGDKTKALVDSRIASEAIKNEVTGFMEDGKTPVIELADLKLELAGGAGGILLAANDTNVKGFQVALNSVPDNQPSVNPFSEPKSYGDVSADEFREIMKNDTSKYKEFKGRLYAILHELDSSNIESDVLEEFADMSIGEMQREYIEEMFDGVIDGEEIAKEIMKDTYLAIAFGYKSSDEVLEDSLADSEEGKVANDLAEKLAKLNDKLEGRESN